jgi:hypothetical protein
MARTRKPLDVVALQVRLPEAMRAQIAAAAEHNKRSLNGEILFRLSETLDARWTEYVAHLEREAQRQKEFIEEMSRKPETRARLDQFIAELREEGIIKPKPGPDGQS